MKHSNSDLKMAAEISEFMQMECCKIDKVRFNKAIDEGGIPHGDMAYAQALIDWNRKGRAKNAWFSYTPGQTECKMLIAFKKEISIKFGLEILTTEDGEQRRKLTANVWTKNVHDWLIN